MDAIAPLLGSLFVLVYVVGVVALTVYVVLLVRRHVLAQERIASAVERIAAVPGGVEVSSVAGVGPDASA